MRFINLCLLANRCKMCFKPNMFTLRHCHFKFNNSYKCAMSNQRMVSVSAPQNARIPQDETGFDADLLEFDDSYPKLTIDEGYARDLLFKNTRDLLLQRISCCASVQEVFKIFETNIRHYDCEHITQTVFVLYDFMRIYQDFSSNLKNPTKSAQEFFEKLEENCSFQKLLTLTEDKVDSFDHYLLSYCVLYLSKLGLGVTTPTMQKLCENLKKMLLEEFSLPSSARFLETVFSETNLYPYFISQELIPLVFREIDLCSTTENLNHVSVSLNKLYKFVTNDTLNDFTRKVEVFIEGGLLTSTDYKTVLQIISFLNYPKWRDKNSVLISRCILLMQSHLNELNIDELLLLYEIFFKIQEPGYVLNNLQRCSYKYFYELDNVPTSQKLTLLSIVAFFTAPHVRSELQKKLQNYVTECEDYDALLLLRRLLSQMKISDIKLCDLYWGKMLKFLKTESDDHNVISLCEHYINFSTDIDNYRHAEFEKEMFKLLATLTKENFQFFPHKLATVLSFTLLYGDDLVVLDNVITKLEGNWQQLKYSSCLKLSYTLRLFAETNKKFEKLHCARRIDKMLDKFIFKKATESKQEHWEKTTLLKSCVYKSKGDGRVMYDMLQTYQNPENICSKSIETIFYSFLMTNMLIPELLDNVAEYILKYKNHVLGFNVAKTIYLCYCLGYRPKKSEELCETAVNIIIRDLERLTGLSILYSALSLCFFNKLPNSLVKSIFNVEFMDKLDNELQQCYSKDKYPNRVRNYLMQLNRAVCLDYPECNVPWFHQKYVDETVQGKTKKPTLFATKVKECLTRIFPNKNDFDQNIVTPYGYEIDFLINLNSKSEYQKRLALLLIPEYAYTTVTPQLKGSYQLKRRHLEILDYKVVFIKFSDWIGLYSAEDRVDFLNNTIFPENFRQSNIETYR